MSLLQIKINEKLQKALDNKAKLYGVSMKVLVQKCLVKSFLHEDDLAGNIFNANRDNNGKGININDFIDKLNE